MLLSNENAPSRPVARSGIGQQMQDVQDELQLHCYPQSIPDFVGPALERLYASLYASMAQLEVEGDTAEVSTCVMRRHGEITDIWLYRAERDEIRVLNEGIAIGADAVRRFASLAFALHPHTHRIRFNAVQPQLDGLGLPWQRLVQTDDSVLVLPPDEHAYLAQLGKATRKNMRRAVQRFEQAFPGFRYEVQEGEAINAEVVHAIVAFNRRRMTAKGKVSGFNTPEAERMLRLARRTGMVCVATIDGRICAGAIVYRVGDNFFSFLRAHDPAYDDHRLGLVGAWHLVRTCIARGGRELHFMWGREPHKALLGAELREFERVIVFRSRVQALRDLDLIVRNAATGFLRSSKRRLLEHAREDDDGFARLLQRAWKAMRGARTVE